MKNRLVSEWDAITRENRLVPLPKKYTVSKILAEFLDANEGREPWPEVRMTATFTFLFPLDLSSSSSGFLGTNDLYFHSFLGVPPLSFQDCRGLAALL